MYPASSGALGRIECTGIAVGPGNINSGGLRPIRCVRALSDQHTERCQSGAILLDNRAITLGDRPMPLFDRLGENLDRLHRGLSCTHSELTLRIVTPGIHLGSDAGDHHVVGSPSRQILHCEITKD